MTTPIDLEYDEQVYRRWLESSDFTKDGGDTYYRLNAEQVEAHMEERFGYRWAYWAQVEADDEAFDDSRCNR